MSSLILNADEVFEVAKRIEHNGEAFYRAAAEYVRDEGAKKLMIELADMERTHKQIFADMQQELGGNELEETLYDPHDDAYQFLKGMADKYVFGPNEAPDSFLREGTDIVSILNAAIRREKDSVIFYEGIKIMVPEKFGGDRIDEIIAQEMGHIIILDQQLQKVQQHA